MNESDFQNEINQAFEPENAISVLKKILFRPHARANGKSTSNAIFDAAICRAIVALEKEKKSIPDTMHTVEVKGPLSYFFPINVSISEDIAKTIVGLPIKNCNHIVIGKITSVDWETGEWFGKIVVDGSVRDKILESYQKSMEITLEKE